MDYLRYRLFYHYLCLFVIFKTVLFQNLFLIIVNPTGPRDLETSERTIDVATGARPSAADTNQLIGETAWPSPDAWRPAMLEPVASPRVVQSA